LIKIIFIINIAIFVKTRDEIMQTDFVPTISVIMGIPIPSGSTGKLINKMLQILNINQMLFAYHYNSKQMYKNYISNKGSINEGIILYF